MCQWWDGFGMGRGEITGLVVDFVIVGGLEVVVSYAGVGEMKMCDERIEERNCMPYVLGEGTRSQ